MTKAELFQPTRPLRGATPAAAVPVAMDSAFQPTRPLRGATGKIRSAIPINIYFNPRAPCGARHERQVCGDASVRISTHAPLAGRDTTCRSAVAAGLYFNPRAPCGARPANCSRLPSKQYFNPRAPCGARPLPADIAFFKDKFQPTRPLRGATGSGTTICAAYLISTHAPLAGRDATTQASTAAA